MKRLFIVMSVIGIAGLVVSCSSTSEGHLIQPTEGKLTFAFFYTDG